MHLKCGYWVKIEGRWIEIKSYEQDGSGHRINGIVYYAKHIQDVSLVAPSTSTDHTPMVQVGRWIKTDVYGWEKVTEISFGKIYTASAYYFPSRIKEVQVSIPDQEWNKLKPSMWVKIAPKEYVKSKLDDIGLYKSTEYNNAKLDSCADSWQEIKYMSCDTEIISFLGNYWHRDFIVDTSETKPLSCSGTPTTVASYGSARREVIAPISDDLWDKLKEGWWVKIAPEDYIKNLLDVNGTYLDIDYRSSRRKKNTFGTWQKVVRKHTSKPSVGVCDTFSIHRDFIVDISETEPQMNCRVLTAKEYFSKHTTSNVSGIGIELDTVNGHTNACKEIPLPGVGGMCVLGTTPTEPDWYYKYLMKDKIKENTMNTVEDIKKLDAANLEEAAKQVKASRDNDEVAAAKSKLTQLLNQESGLKARKKEIDADLAEVQELIKAFGYPPKEGK
jgi:hypothetical protein